MSTATSDTTLQTPILDSEFSSLLQRIAEEGGYAFASMVARAAAGDTRAAEAAREMAWEQLHSGPWNSVVPIWRDAYAMACLHVAKHHYSSGELTLALKSLDLGLIMGGLTLRDDLNSCIGKVSAVLRRKELSDNGGGLQKGEWYRDFNLAERRVRLLKDGVQPFDADCAAQAYDSSTFYFTKSFEKVVSFLELLDILGKMKELDQSLVVKLLPVKSLSSETVRKRRGLSLEGFMLDHFIPGSPVIISDSMNYWPAKSRWSDMNYLKNVAGFRTVPVEIQELKRDIVTPDYCFAGGGDMRSINAWFGPSGTVTPLHHDPHHNILAQVVGKKYIRLYPASLSDEVYPHAESMLSNSSQVDLDNIDEKEFPRILDLEFVDCILEEGEMLYIPPKWWHYVRSLTPSFSVSFWWSHEGNSSDT
ncbi:2-oxoglutarate (2OG) and Fe(II)-dependent oxygenase superfamily protein [Striga asiatica]|uniref:2-oxoglutarate (2OG) and Fe(II)-dependent oxygenase superfamily protein n=1 Tax=Striga asiatica TaxID=4170 RepID=A0A5A7NX33_STRAF|nr:2-oxoglutarate (2OG) and Fe(II)-dependent oxygenase superfamily protein [Striga asiatica]